jgi:hypothetical protein
MVSEWMGLGVVQSLKKMIIREYIKELLESTCPKDERGHGQYYSVDAKNPPPLTEILECWIDSSSKVYDSDMPLWYSVSALAPYREYRRDRLRNDADGQRYLELKKSISENGLREPLHVELGKNGVIKIGEGNHRHEIAMELGLEKVPVNLHFYQHTELTVHPMDLVKKKPAPRPRKPKPVPVRPARVLSAEEQKEKDAEVDDLMSLLGL